MNIYRKHYSSENEYKPIINVHKENSETKPNPNYIYEEERHKTMMRFPHKLVMDIIAVAHSGLHFINDEDYLKCHFCEVIKGKWIGEKDCVFKHLPECNMSSNIPLACNKFYLKDNLKPKYPMYETWAARVASFAGWPCRTKQTPLQLAEAGLFYTGCRDQTFCFCCGETIKDWAVNDDPWHKHSLLKKGQDCKFLINMKGLKFIRDVYYDEDFDNEANVSTLENPIGSDWEGEGENKDDKLCKICYNQNKNVTFIPCGHVVACHSCATALHSCPICRNPHTNILTLRYN